VALPAFQFLLYRWLYRWALWIWMLLSLARLPLTALATHPDRRGGLAFLSEPSLACAGLVAAGSAVQAGVWADRVLYDHAPITAFKGPLIVTLLIWLTLAFGPLLAFGPVLFRTRFHSLREYGLLARQLSGSFKARWVGRGDEILGSPDPSTLIDFISSFDVIQQMHLWPFGIRDLAILSAAAVVPMVPVVLLQVPFLELAGKLAHVVLGL
jgi:hypothetical protein